MSCKCTRSNDHVKEEPFDSEISCKCAKSNDHVKEEPIDSEYPSKETNKSQICAFSSEETKETKNCDFAPEEMQECQICVFYPEETHDTHKNTYVQRHIATMYDSQTFSQSGNESGSSSSSEHSSKFPEEECQTSFSDEKQVSNTSNVEKNKKNKEKGLCQNLSIEIDIEPIIAGLKLEPKEFHEVSSPQAYLKPQEVLSSSAHQNFTHDFEMNQPPLFYIPEQQDGATEIPVQKAFSCKNFDKPINIKVEVTMELRPKCKNDKPRIESKIEPIIEQDSERLQSVDLSDCERLKSLDVIKDESKTEEARSETKDECIQSDRSRSPSERRRRSESKERKTDAAPQRKTCKKCRCHNGLYRCKSKMDPKIDRCRRCCDCATKKRNLSTAEKQMIFNVYENLLNETGKDLIECPGKEERFAELAKELGISKTSVCAIFMGKNHKETDTKAK